MSRYAMCNYIKHSPCFRRRTVTTNLQLALGKNNRVQVAPPHPLERPQMCAPRPPPYVDMVCREFREIHGDRTFRRRTPPSTAAWHAWAADKVDADRATTKAAIH
jgi:hypothetical protein